MQVFDDAVEQVRRWQDEGLRTALITSSRNGRRILKAAGLEELFEHMGHRFDPGLIERNTAYSTCSAPRTAPRSAASFTTG